MSKTIMKALAGGAALAAIALGASAIAGASSDTPAGTAANSRQPMPPPYGDPPPGMRGGPPGRGKDVTGATADKVKAAALAKYPGGKIERIEELPDGTYVAHVIKAGGSELHVLVNKQFEVTGTDTGGPGGRRGGPDGRGDCPGGHPPGAPPRARRGMPTPPAPGAARRPGMPAPPPAAQPKQAPQS